jgi:hypothetical protein
MALNRMRESYSPCPCLPVLSIIAVSAYSICFNDARSDAQAVRDLGLIDVTTQIG